MMACLRDLVSVFKLRIGVAIMVCALAGLAVTPGPRPAAWQIVILALAVLLSSASAGALNQYVERDLDARMRRTRRRPFVTGRLHPGPAWLTAIMGLLAVAVVASGLSTNWAAATYVFLGAFVYGVVYTVWLKLRSWTNIVVGGLAGSFAVLAGAAAVDPRLAPAPVILAVVLFLWTPPHFWSLAAALENDYARAGMPMLPVVIGVPATAWVILGHALTLTALSLTLVRLGMGWIYLAGAAVGGVVFTWRSIELVLEPTGARAWPTSTPRSCNCLCCSSLRSSTRSCSADNGPFLVRELVPRLRGDRGQFHHRGGEVRRGCHDRQLGHGLRGFSLGDRHRQ